jgi:hypothetical protein
MKRSYIIFVLTIFILKCNYCFAETKRKSFIDLKECFKFVSSSLDTTWDLKDKDLFKLATDSSMKYYYFGEYTKRMMFVFDINYIDKDSFISRVKGATGNGVYFAFEYKNNKYYHIGIFEGHSLIKNNGKTFTCYWNMGGSHIIKSEYLLKDNYFEVISIIEYTYDQNGKNTFLKKHKVKDNISIE